MEYKLFLDTNVIIDFVQERKYEPNAIKEIIHLGELGNVKDFSFQFPSLPVISPTNFIKEIYLNDLS